MTISEQELLNCPFCGKEAQICWFRKKDKFWIASCSMAACIGFHNVGETKAFNSAEEAIKAWNRRIK